MGLTIGYARVSTREQAENHHALNQQIDRLKQAGVETVYHDIESGDSSERPNFLLILNLVRQGIVSSIVATRWDRLTRNESIYLELKKILTSHNVELNLLDQGPVDLLTASGELSADMQALIAVHERRMLKERVNRGFDYRRKRLAASARAPWGYTTKEDKYVLNRKPIVCLLQERPENYLELYEEPDNSPRLSGISKADIANESITLFKIHRKPRKVVSILNEKYGVEIKSSFSKSHSEQNSLSSKSSLKFINPVLSEELLFWISGDNFRTWLINPVLRGHTVYKKTDKNRKKKSPKDWEWHYNTHPNEKLLSDEEFVEIEAILKANSRKVAASGKTCFLTGLIFCNNCLRKCILKRGSGYSYYGCRQSALGCNNRGCVRLEKIDQAIIHALFDKALSLGELTKSEVQIHVQSPELVKLKQDLLGLEQLPGLESNQTLKQAKNDLIKQIKSLENQAKLFNFETATALEVLQHTQARKLPFWYTLTEEEREIIYEKLVRKVFVLGEEVIDIELNV